MLGPNANRLTAGVVVRATIPESTDPQELGRYVLADITAATDGLYTVVGVTEPGCPLEAMDMRVEQLETVATTFTDRDGASRPLPPPASALGEAMGQGMGQDVFVTLPFRSTGPATVCLAGGTAGAVPSVIWSVWFDARTGQTIEAALKGSPDLRLALTGAAAGSPQANAVAEGDSQVARLTIPSDGIYSAGLIIPSAALQAGPVPYDLSVKVAQ